MSFRRAGNRGRAVKTRRLRFEPLENRRVLAAGPFLETALLHQVLPTDGTGLTIGVDAGHAKDEAITVSAASDDPDVSVFIPQGNRYARMSFADADGTPIGDIIVEIFETRGGDAAARMITLATTGYCVSVKT